MVDGSMHISFFLFIRSDSTDCSTEVAVIVVREELPGGCRGAVSTAFPLPDLFGVKSFLGLLFGVSGGVWGLYV